MVTPTTPTPTLQTSALTPITSFVSHAAIYETSSAMPPTNEAPQLTGIAERRQQALLQQQQSQQQADRITQSRVRRFVDSLVRSLAFLRSDARSRQQPTSPPTSPPVTPPGPVPSRPQIHHVSHERVQRPGKVAPDSAQALLSWTTNHLMPVLLTNPGFASTAEFAEGCSICHEPYSLTSPSHMPIRIANVRGCQEHVFGNSCIIKWITSGLSNANTCPMDRARLGAPIMTERERDSEVLASIMNGGSGTGGANTMSWGMLPPPGYTPAQLGYVGGPRFASNYGESFYHAAASASATATANMAHTQYVYRRDTPSPEPVIQAPTRDDPMIHLYSHNHQYHVATATAAAPAPAPAPPAPAPAPAPVPDATSIEALILAAIRELAATSRSRIELLEESRARDFPSSNSRTPLDALDLYDPVDILEALEAPINTAMGDPSSNAAYDLDFEDDDRSGAGTPYHEAPEPPNDDDADADRAHRERVESMMEQFRDAVEMLPPPSPSPRTSSTEEEVDVAERLFGEQQRG
ncbi:hypothetical protein BU24DRAFT_487434 [Aaosphaeria arxii CBS 175.79]|uniref:RING-type domain-containing protein n=1 Tax=Aaosphaeria arxii CBS 175.79 TaxID=1450172 RepID=A0A6A5Y8M0_9PLEO|nr:uncharacterized protein BU24DRAFT_487434 [Aaosphaeria arxii CBS 175.79]KAF2020914.1 hypothetical protein BU24DRAFT_487434 [Aaosphaeria arxii CBS 175.79]